eukprot:TRINITY_DN3759_c0_g1_i1.p1 TRINITY_DN3759_c0_g1~~TRINITY_DN3759_c0_g1_i1.p1  ORF type:complete len:752 (-),score=162.80 TRINITY_DN3759_c0_g1_i1:233-2488(-)
MSASKDKPRDTREFAKLITVAKCPSALLIASSTNTTFKTQYATAATATGTPELHLDKGKRILRGAATLLKFFVAGQKDYALPADASASTNIDVEQWLEYVSVSVSSSTDLLKTCDFLDNHLTLRTFFAGYSITIADLAVWGALTDHSEWSAVQKDESMFPHLFRWYKFLSTKPAFAVALSGKKKPSAAIVAAAVNPDPKSAATKTEEKKDGGSFDIELPGASEGTVVTRFPPEPSGFLHIGHAKAAFLNDYYARHYKGRLILRFDDTNPSKEKEEFVENIFTDLDTLGIKPDVVTHTSDYFNVILEYAYKLIKKGQAYVDDTPVEKLRAERMDGIESKNRSNTVEENLALFEEILKATPRGLQCCLRAKIDMQAKNKALRDPILYRCNLNPHHRTGTKHKAYPTYDFACPIVDSIEGVTHALRTSEYHDRNDQYYWVIDACEIRKPYIWDYSRLNFVYTLLSKRKLQWFVDKQLVEGWNDPRFPTVQGLLRRGLLVEAMKQFILVQGASKNINLMEWEKLWVINKRLIDPVAPRFSAVASVDRVPLTLVDGPSSPEGRTLLKHKKNPEVGNKVTIFYKTILLDQEDAREIAQDEEITLMDWGNAFVTGITRDETGKVTALEGKLNLEGSVKNTKKKLQWVADTDDVVSLVLVEFGHLMTKKKLEEDDDFLNFINGSSRKEIQATGDANLRNLQKGDIIQLERKGYFIVDRPYINASKPPILFGIPDGHSKEVAPEPAKKAAPEAAKKTAKQ